MPLDLDMPLRKQQMRSEEQPLTLFPKKKSRGSSPTEEVYWWRLNNTNCNLHDMSLTCEGKTIDQCKTVCQNDPACGGFLYYTKTGKMALKNSTCWVRTWWHVFRSLHLSHIVGGTCGPVRVRNIRQQN
eukprot:m.721384 g.721384  ORF g.721384 m.721384 type:complete len:129 (+) comp23013_c0_seq12:1774-2160(+)